MFMRIPVKEWFFDQTNIESQEIGGGCLREAGTKRKREARERQKKGEMRDGQRDKMREEERDMYM